MVCDTCINNRDKCCLIYGYYIIHPAGTCDDYEEDVDD